ncbi:MAG TPA: hypothetical protein DCX53_04465 [Anaerolineae bacterium]|nr:hypothetical protein [Anaerolineae bacterium]
MKILSHLRTVIFGLAAIIIITSMTAVAATNTVPTTRVANQTISFNINHLKPSACAGLNVTSLVIGSGIFTGTNENDLILGGPGMDSIDGLGGNDCILGGGGDDEITGNDGNDICIGGPGVDIFISCEGQVQ